MRHSRETTPTPTPAGSAAPSRDGQTLRRLLPYLWAYKWRVTLALAFMVAAKVSNVAVPVLLKNLVDAMNVRATDPQALLVVPVALLLGYGGLRLMTSVMTELREWVFAKVTHGAARQIALQTFEHLHAQSLRFHLDRQTGGMTRDIERGVRAIESLISYSLYTVVPTLIEVLLVLAVLAVQFDPWFAAITLVALAVYVAFTVRVTQWRTQFRQQANQLDSVAHTQAVDSLLNYETVKYFGNERFEALRYADSLERLKDVQIKARTTLSLLNTGQQLIIALALLAVLWRATQGVVDGRMTLGDFVMCNAFMIQLYIPLNFLGVLYREIKQSLTDLDRLFALIDLGCEIADLPDAQPLALQGAPEVRFDDVHFGYDGQRPVLHGISFVIPAGQTVAVVGPSGSGKSTLARLLYRFYDVQQGAVRVGGQDVRHVTQASLRQAVGMVPQDTVLFNDSLRHNLAYGRPSASQTEIEAAAQSARIHGFIASLPAGYDTSVGERGLKLSGGEKQRVAIARTLLKDPPVLVLDEATSALDSANERAIQAALAQVAQHKTTLVIAHRLSTVVDAHMILVMDAGRIIERGTHAQLLAQAGRYAQMWALQHAGEAHGNQVA